MGIKVHLIEVVEKIKKVILSKKIITTHEAIYIARQYGVQGGDQFVRDLVAEGQLHRIDKGIYSTMSADELKKFVLEFPEIRQFYELEVKRLSKRYAIDVAEKQAFIKAVLFWKSSHEPVGNPRKKVLKLMDSLVITTPGVYTVKRIVAEDATRIVNRYENFESYIACQRIAEYMSKILGITVPVNKAEVQFENGDEILVCKFSSMVQNQSGNGNEVPEDVFEWWVVGYRVE